MKPTRALLLISLAAGIAACASKSSGTTTASGGTATAARRDPSVLDSTQLRSGNYSTVFDAIQRIHADWLLPRGGPSGGRNPELGVFVEGQVRNRGVEYLKSLRPVDVMKIRRLTITESTGSYNWPWGGLVVTSRY
jgi:hypothetical protein